MDFHIHVPLKKSEIHISDFTSDKLIYEKNSQVVYNGIYIVYMAHHMYQAHINAWQRNNTINLVSTSLGVHFKVPKCWGMMNVELGLATTCLV